MMAGGVVMKRIFDVFDEDNDGTLIFPEIAQGMLHFRPSDKVRNPCNEGFLMWPVVCRWTLILRSGRNGYAPNTSELHAAS